MDVSIPEHVGFSSARLRRIDDTMRRLIDTGKIAGAVTLLARRGQVAHHAAYGQLDVQTGQPMQCDAIFRIASMTKPIVAATVMMLFEEAHFLLDDPIAGFIPEFAQTKVFVRETNGGVELTDLERPITIRHLLTHTSGLTYGFVANGPVHRMYAQIAWDDAPLDRQVKRLAELPLVFQPGSHWEYSVAIDVLGRLVEIVSGQTLDVFLKERILDPLDMIDTGFFVPPANLSRLSAVHTPAPGDGLQRDDNPQQDCSRPPIFLSGGGGLVSTAADYARFCQMLVSGGVLDGQRVLGRKTVDLLLADQFPQGVQPFTPAFALDPGTSHALGGSTVVNAALTGLPTTAGTYSWVGSYSTGFWIDPKEEMYGIFQCQLAPFDFRSFTLFQVLAYQAIE
jgi:CubicO group peptidase (beta-lactamase class C family)